MAPFAIYKLDSKGGTGHLDLSCVLCAACARSPSILSSGFEGLNVLRWKTRDAKSIQILQMQRRPLWNLSLCRAVTLAELGPTRACLLPSGSRWRVWRSVLDRFLRAFHGRMHLPSPGCNAGNGRILQPWQLDALTPHKSSCLQTATLISIWSQCWILHRSNSSGDILCQRKVHMARHLGG